MWNPSIKPILPRPESQLNFEEHCCHMHEFYAQYLEQFKVMVTAVKEIHKRYGIEGALDKGRTTAVKGSLSMTVRLKPVYKLRKIDKGFSIEDKYAYENDYGTEFAFDISGYGGKYTSIIGLKAIAKGSIMMHEVEAFPTSQYNIQVIPDWYVKTVKDFLK